ncbi:CC0125/CC1285 family lipoprotein [Limimonas halophila]|nr:hypothetical protein [Limimonas halophila]
MRGVCLVAGMLALAACAQPTPYQPANGGDGYSEQELEPGRYRVTFTGNAMTPRERVANGLLLRAAEITKRAGGEHFIVVNRDVERATTYRSSFSGFTRTGFHRFHDPYGFGGGITTSTARPIDRYAAYANIVVRDGPKPADQPNAYAADALIERLKPSFTEPDAD